MSPDIQDENKPPDRRAERWQNHREARREELVRAAVAAINLHGPGARIAEIAEVANVSKPVLYRYFADKDDLYRAVGHWGANEVLSALRPILHGNDSIREKIHQCCADYLRLIEEHPQVFLLLVEHHTSSDPLRDGKELIAQSFSRRLGQVLHSLDLDTGGADPWGHGIVGLGLAHGEWWLRRRTTNRTMAAAYLADFIWHAVSGIAASNGVSLEPATVNHAKPT